MPKKAWIIALLGFILLLPACGNLAIIDTDSTITESEYYRQNNGGEQK